MFGDRPVLLKLRTLPGTESISVPFRMILYREIIPFGVSGGSHVSKTDVERTAETVGGLCSSGAV